MNLKRRLLTFALIFSLMSGYSQETAVTKKLAANFVNYYNTDQADSLVTLFSDEVKKQMPPANVPALISQLKGQFGKLPRASFSQ